MPDIYRCLAFTNAVFYQNSFPLWLDKQTIFMWQCCLTQKRFFKTMILQKNKSLDTWDLPIKWTMHTISNCSCLQEICETDLICLKRVLFSVTASEDTLCWCKILTDGKHYKTILGIWLQIGEYFVKSTIYHTMSPRIVSWVTLIWLLAVPIL